MGKIQGPHVLLCVHASRDTPIISRYYKCVRYSAGKRSLCLTQCCRVVTVATPNGCPASTAPRVCSPDQKGAQEVCEPTGGFIITRVGHVQKINHTSKLLVRIVAIRKQTVMIGLMHAFLCRCIIISIRGRLLSIS